MPTTTNTANTTIAKPKISFLVSVAAGLDFLPCMLWCLKAQWFKDIEVLVTDSSKDPAANAHNLLHVQLLNDPRFRYLHVGLPNCYQCAEVGVQHTTGEYVVFASDDDYYVPGFASRMLAAAEQSPKADLVYCDVVYDPRWARGHCRINDDQQCMPELDTWVHYTPRPIIGEIAKAGILVRRSLYDSVGGFPGSNTGIGSDGFFVYKAMQLGAIARKAPGSLWVHN
jgi:GT2 family glycosyltransferase